MKIALMLLPCLILAAGCGSAPVASTAAVATTATPTLKVTCPSGTTLVQNTTCEETTVHAATTQLSAKTICTYTGMHLCSMSERTGQFAIAHQEVAGTYYWLADTAIGGNGFVVEDAQVSAVAGGNYPYFCCVTGAVSL